MITLTYSGVPVTLSEDFNWSDEFSWQPVEQTVSRTITGALIIEAATRVGGRPITLEPPDDQSAWMTLTDLNTIRTWAAVAGRVMTLSIRGVGRNVMFSHQETSAVSAKPVVFYSSQDTTDNYLVTLKFMEVVV